MEGVSLPVAFGAGFLSFFSPCVLPLVPVYIANIAGTSAVDPSFQRYKTTLLHTLSFVAGFSLIFIALGTSVGAMGEFIGQNTDVLLKISGGLIIAFGVFLLISPKIPWLNYEKRLSLPITGAGYFRSLSMGMVFSLAWTPCVGPVLGSILTLALSSQEAWQGTYLLTLYSLGLGIPFILIGVGWRAALPYLKKVNQHLNIVSIVSGIILIAVGGLILSGEFGQLNF